MNASLVCEMCANLLLIYPQRCQSQMDKFVIQLHAYMCVRCAQRENIQKSNSNNKPKKPPINIHADDLTWVKNRQSTLATDATR